MKNPYKSISDFIFVEPVLEKADVILIPGCNKLEAIEGAVNLYNQGYSSLLLPSGGQNKLLNGYDTEWEMFKDRAIELGVREKDILKEDKARNTFENAIYSLETLSKNNVNVKSAIISCKWIHSRRALLTYETIFPKDVEFFIAPVLDDKKIYKSNWYYNEEQVNMVMDEVIKIGKYFQTEIYNFMK